MASTVVESVADDSGSDHEHWPEDFKTSDAIAAPGYDSNNGLRMHTYHATAPVAKEPSPPPSPKESVKAAPLTQVPAQYAYVPAPAPNMSGYVYAAVPAPAQVVAPAPASVAAPKPEEPNNTYTYHPTFTEKPAVKETYKWQGRTKGEVQEDNLKIAAEEKVWEKRKVVPTGLATDQMCWVVEVDGNYTLR